MGIHLGDDADIQPYLDVIGQVLGDVAVVAPYISVQFLVDAEAAAKQDEELLAVAVDVVEIGGISLIEFCQAIDAIPYVHRFPELLDAGPEVFEIPGGELFEQVSLVLEVIIKGAGDPQP